MNLLLMNNLKFRVKHYLLFCLTLNLFFNSCKQDISYTNLTNKMTLQKLDLSNNSILVVKNDSEIYTFNKSTFSLICYNILTDSIISHSSFKNVKLGIRNIYVKNIDTIYVGTDDTFFYEFTKKKCRKIHILNYPQFDKELITISDIAIDKLDIDTISYRLRHYPNWNIDYTSVNYLSDSKNMPILSNYLIGSSGDLIFDKILIYNNSIFNKTFYYSKNIFYSIKNDTIIFMFPKISKVYIKTGATIYEKNIDELKFLNSNHFIQDSFYSINYVMKSFVISSEIILFEKLRNTDKFIVIARHNQNYTSPNKFKINKASDADLSIIILDSNFEVYKNLRLKGNLFKANKVYYFSNKIYLQSINNLKSFYEIQF